MFSLHLTYKSSLCTNVYINGMHFETENCIRLKLVTWNEDLQNISDKIIAFYVDKNTFVNTK